MSARVELEIYNIDHSSSVVYTPSSRSAVPGFQVEIPPILEHSDEADFRLTVQKAVNQSCGKVACPGLVSVSTSKFMSFERERVVDGVTIFCNHCWF